MLYLPAGNPCVRSILDVLHTAACHVAFGLSRFTVHVALVLLNGNSEEAHD